MSEDQPPKGYVVRDRRRFDTEGNQRDEGREAPLSAARQAARPAAPAPQPPPRPAPPPPAPPRAEPPPAQSSPSARARRAAETVDFSQLVLSIATNAMISLEGASPDGRVVGRPNLPAAEQNIGILLMLEEKTRGNLSAEEAELLKSVLYDLRMQYLAIQQGLGGA